jgi:hypothetical protein
MLTESGTADWKPASDVKKIFFLVLRSRFLFNSTLSDKERITTE